MEEGQEEKRGGEDGAEINVEVASLKESRADDLEREVLQGQVGIPDVVGAHYRVLTGAQSVEQGVDGRASMAVGMLLVLEERPDGEESDEAERCQACRPPWAKEKTGVDGEAQNDPDGEPVGGAAVGRRWQRAVRVMRGERRVRRTRAGAGRILVDAGRC